MEIIKFLENLISMNLLMGQSKYDKSDKILKILKSMKKRYSSGEKFKKYVKFVSAIVIYVIIFACIYYGISESDNDFFQEGNKFGNFLDAIYYSTMSTFTVGFGDYSPKEWYSRLVTITQVILFWSIVLYFTITVVE